MMQIRRSAREVGSWIWSVPYTHPPNLTDILAAPEAALDALRSERLLRQGDIRIFWEDRGANRGEIASLPIIEERPLADLVRTVEDSTPSDYTNPFINYIKVEGRGTLTFPHGHSATLEKLIEVNIFHFSDSVDIELTVHHDIWFPHAFDGYPHPEVYELNAPRLTAALQQIESGLGQETEPGDGTFFGQPTKHGIFSPQRDFTNDPDLLDVTDISNVGWTFHEVLWEE